MIVIGDRVRVRAGGETGKVIRTFLYPAYLEKLLFVRLDNPDRFDCLLTTAWEGEVEPLNSAEERMPS